MSNFIKNIFKNNESAKGFTIIEMIVVIGIFSIMTAVVVFQYGNFNSKIILTNMAYEVALSTRQAQVYSLGVRGQVGEDNFSNRYGVYFDLTETGDSEGEKFVFFIDRGEDGSPEDADSICNDPDNDSDPTNNCFECITGSECLESYSFLRDIRIDSVCLSEENEPINSENVCENDENINAATITFERPNPDAIIKNPYGGNLSNQTYNSAAIFITNKNDDKRAVIIKSTGQISIDFLND